MAVQRSLPRRALWLAGLAVLFVLGACTPAQPSPGGVAGGPRAQPTAPKSLTIALKAEPEQLVTSLGVGGVSGTAGDIKPAYHQHLATYDDRGAVHPQLATELPSQAAGSWIVRDDGTMQTTYRLRPNVTWHDGAPLTASDFVFAWTVTTDAEIPMTNRVIASQVARIDTPDQLTLVIDWRHTYPFANAIQEDDLGPLPAHILDSVYRTDKERFAALPYWRQDFIGVGPYRLAAWEPGSHLVLKAYDRFYAGRPHVETITVRFITDAATAVANLLAGTIDGEIGAVELDGAMVVKGQWEVAGRNPTIIVAAERWRVMSVQFREPKPRELTDVRVRRGLLHGLDRQTMVDTLAAGLGQVSHSFVSPKDLQWDWVHDVVVRYDYDQRRARNLLGEAGWRSAGEELVDASGERVGVAVWTTGGGGSDRELAIIGDAWKGLGIAVEQVILGSAQTRDLKLRASFPAFDITTAGASRTGTLRRAHAGDCPTEESRWAGTNRGCYQSPEMDRLVDGLLGTAIDPADQQRLYRDLVRSQTEDLPVLPLYFNPNMRIFREGVTGVRGDARFSGGATWNVADWDVL